VSRRTLAPKSASRVLSEPARSVVDRAPPTTGYEGRQYSVDEGSQTDPAPAGKSASSALRDWPGANSVTRGHSHIVGLLQHGYVGSDEAGTDIRSAPHAVFPHFGNFPEKRDYDLCVAAGTIPN
jgi:hypothetical protein